MEVEFGPRNAAIFTRAAAIANSPEFLATFPKGLPAMFRDTTALARAVGEAVPMGQVWKIGEYQGRPVWGTVRTYLGITEINGETVIVHVHPALPPRVLGRFRP